MFKSIRDRRVLITGASGGIGACMVLLFAEHGAVVGVHYNQGKEEADRLVREIEKNGGRGASFQADLTAEAGETLIPSFIDRFGGIEVLINNAGAVFGSMDFLELDIESWEKTFQLNARAPFFLARQAFSHMKDHGGGKIINISSISAKYGGSAKTMHYGAAKAALEAITVGMSRAGAPHDILVNAIRGGFIDTPMHQKLGRGNLEKRIEMIPLKRAGKAEDVARMALFLASEGGDFITGEILTVAGGD
ncbi:MAG: SDR family oxidoreductase [Nitrospinae bacterium]|nr:SDR family oxidoreductase [Nitrospinota bacterium]